MPPIYQRLQKRWQQLMPLQKLVNRKQPQKPCEHRDSIGQTFAAKTVSICTTRDKSNEQQPTQTSTRHKPANKMHLHQLNSNTTNKKHTNKIKPYLHKRCQKKKYTKKQPYTIYEKKNKNYLKKS